MLTDSPQPIELPKRLLELAQKPLPISDLFNLSVNDADALDESDLPVWDHPPPYTSLPPPATADEDRFTENIVDVMHGRRLRQSRKKEKERMDRCMRSDVEDVRQMLKHLLQADRDAWVEANVLVESFVGCERHRLMAENYLQWSARCVHGLSIELQAVLAGMSFYRDLYCTRYPSE